MDASPIHTPGPKLTTKRKSCNCETACLAVRTRPRSMPNMTVPTNAVTMEKKRAAMAIPCEPRKREKNNVARDRPAVTMCRMSTERRPFKIIWAMSCERPRASSRSRIPSGTVYPSLGPKHCPLFSKAVGALAAPVAQTPHTPNLNSVARLELLTSPVDFRESRYIGLMIVRDSPTSRTSTNAQKETTTEVMDTLRWAARGFASVIIA